MRAPSAPLQECTTKIAGPTPSFASASSIIPAWIAGVESSGSRARAPAMPGTIDQDHAVIFGKPVAERLSHDLQIRTRAMDHHERRTVDVARPDIDDVEFCAGDRRSSLPCAG